MTERLFLYAESESIFMIVIAIFGSEVESCKKTAGTGSEIFIILRIRIERFAFHFDLNKRCEHVPARMKAYLFFHTAVIHPVEHALFR